MGEFVCRMEGVTLAGTRGHGPHGSMESFDLVRFVASVCDRTQTAVPFGSHWIAGSNCVANDHVYFVSEKSGAQGGRRNQSRFGIRQREASRDQVKLNPWSKNMSYVIKVRTAFESTDEVAQGRC